MATFISTIPALNASMKIGGSTHYFNFTPKGKPYSYGYLYVSDPKEKAALMKHPYFGSIITLEKDDASIVAPVEKKVIASYPEVTGSQAAIAILSKKHGVASDKLKNKAAVKQVAEELNIDFPNLK